MAQADMQQCIQECTTCHQVCVNTMRHCLQKGGSHAQADHIRGLADCPTAVGWT